MEPSENKDCPMETEVSDELHKPHVPWIPSDGSSSDSSTGDDEWRPCRRKQTRKVNPLRSQATKLIWKRRKAAALLLQKQMAQESATWSSSRPLDSASTSSLAQAAPLVPPTQSAQRPTAKAASGRFPICWSDTTLGSSLPGKGSKSPLKAESSDKVPRTLSSTSPRKGKVPPDLRHAQPGADSWSLAQGAGQREEASRHNGEHACHPKLYSSSAEDGEPPPGVPIPVATCEVASTATSEATAEAESKMCTKRSRMSLAAKLRWEQRRAKMNLAATSADRRQEAPPATRQEMCRAVEISVARTAPHTVAGTPKSGTPKSGTPKPGTPKPGTPKPGTPKPGTPKPASGSSVRRSEAKRRWWQRLRQLTAGTGTSRDVPGECTAAVLHSFPKFLQAELFAEAKRRSDTEGAKEGTVAAPSGSSTSRRSAAMKENWRRRKQTWLSAAAEALAAANRPTSLAGQVAGARPADRLDCTPPAQQNGQRLARSLALWRCRQRRCHAVCGQVYASESTSLSKEYLKGWSQSGGVAPTP